MTKGALDIFRTVFVIQPILRYLSEKRIGKLTIIGEVNYVSLEIYGHYFCFRGGRRSRQCAAHGQWIYSSKKRKAGDTKIIRPGFLVNIFIGGIGALVTWGLYGPFAQVFIIGGTNDPNIGTTGLSLTSVVGGLLVGVGGARWLTNEVDKKLLRAAASKAASGQSNDQKAIRISAASPAEALNIAAE